MCVNSSRSETIGKLVIECVPTTDTCFTRCTGFIYVTEVPFRVCVDFHTLSLSVHFVLP